MKRLFLVLLVPFIIGIYISYNIVISITYVIIGITLSIAGLVVSFFSNKGYIVSLCIVFLFLGIFATINSIDSRLIDIVEKELIFEGVVESRTRTYEEYSTYIVKLNRFYYNDKFYQKVEEKILLNYYDKGLLDVGDKIRVKGILLIPKENTNPRLFNYRLYLQTEDIHTRSSADKSSLNVISKGELTKVKLLKIKFEKKITLVLDNALNEKNSGLMKSIILGDGSFLDEETGMKFRDLGISHILAVSGLHIGIIYLFISKILKFIGIDKRLSIIIALIVIWIYGFLISFPASVLRASIMFSFLSISTLVYRRYDPINTLSFAALILLIIRPMWIFDVGFQLSFIATASIVLFTPRIKWLLSIRYKRGAKLLSPLIAVQIGMFPIVAYHFNTYAVMSLISNLILIPIFSFSLILCFILILVSFIYLNASMFLGVLLNVILNIINIIIDMFYKFPLINVFLPSLGIGYILSYYFLLLISLRIIKVNFFNHKINKLISNYMILAIVVSVLSTATLNETILEFIDVGQGDSCLISTKNKVFLVDTGGSAFGNFDVGERIVLPYLIKKGINKLDAVLITHFHEDHCQGIISLMNNIKIDNIFIGYENTESQLFNEIMYLASTFNIRVSKISENDSIYIDKNNIIKVLSPSFDMGTDNFPNENELSLVLRFITHQKNILFTGDIEKETEDKIRNEHKLDNIDIIKVPHHGSSTSSSLEIVNKLNPTYAVIQVGKNNFGHPTNEVLKRYEDIGAKILRNDKNGLVSFRINSQGIKVYTFIKDKPILNDIIVEYRYIILVLFIYVMVSIVLCNLYKLCYNRETMISIEDF